MTDQVSEVILDGNAAAGLLQEIFAPEITMAQIQCAACDASERVGALGLYAMPMGAVLRCPHCQEMLLTAVHTPHGRWLAMTGTRCLKF
jgi:Family of unknown function (DUF6510)